MTRAMIVVDPSQPDALNSVGLSIKPTGNIGEWYVVALTNDTLTVSQWGLDGVRQPSSFPAPSLESAARDEPVLI